jgi:hypothetical protein
MCVCVRPGATHLGNIPRLGLFCARGLLADPHIQGLGSVQDERIGTVQHVLAERRLGHLRRLQRARRVRDLEGRTQAIQRGEGSGPVRARSYTPTRGVHDAG